MQGVHLWGLKVSTVRFTFNSHGISMAHMLFTLENVELMVHRQRALSTALHFEIYKRAPQHGLIKVWSLDPKKKMNCQSR